MPIISISLASWSIAACDLSLEGADEENHQGVAVVNYTDRETPCTRVIEHKHFEFGTQPKTVITKRVPGRLERGHGSLIIR